MRRDALDENGRDRAALDDGIERRNQWALGAALGAALLAATAAALLISNRQSSE